MGIFTRQSGSPSGLRFSILAHIIKITTSRKALENKNAMESVLHSLPHLSVKADCIAGEDESFWRVTICLHRYYYRGSFPYST